MNTQIHADLIVDAVAYRKLHTMYRDHMAAHEIIPEHDEEALVEWALKLGKIVSMMRGETPVDLGEKLSTTPIKEALKEARKNRVFFYVPVSQSRQAKQLLKQAYSLDFLPNAKRVSADEGDPNTVRFSIYFTTATTAVTLQTRFPEIFTKAEASTAPVRTN